MQISQAQCDEYFRDFAACLESFQLDGGDGEKRFASADEFMLMSVDRSHRLTVHFKHRDSRNYIFMVDKQGWQLELPRSVGLGDAFCKGVFPVPIPLPADYQV